MLTFSSEKLQCLTDRDLLQHLHAHWEEVGNALCPQSIFHFDRAMHEHLERKGLWKAFSARNEQGCLSGYAAYFIAPHAFMNERVATLEVLYLKPSQRKGQQALALLRFAERTLSRKGIHAVHYGSPASRDCGILFRRLGCRVMETLWRKEIAS